MNTNYRAGFLAVACFCFAGLLSAQKSTVNELLTRADRQFDLYSYNLAIQTYEDVLKEEKSNAHALARIGDCHYQLNRPEKAVEWYQKALNTYNMEPDVPLRLGKALLQTGDYDAAKDQFLLYAETDDKVGRHYANLVDYAIKNSRKDAQWQVKNETVNTSSADFGPAFYQSGVAFNSARTDMSPRNKTGAESAGGSANFLYVSQRNPESELLQKPSFLRSDVQNNRNEGPVSFSANGRKVAFCRNKFISGTRQIAGTGMSMSIYIADVEDGNWKNVKSFPYNGSGYATGFPCLSPDGNKLIFASTQPGGFGGWDIYVSNLTATGWSEPRNLGTPLNTPGDEITPYFDGEDLYFSSDWHNGFGGMDVFRASLGREEVTDIFNLGPGINSPRDDYGFIYHDNDNIGYLTSTRSGGRGNEDIWMVSKKWDDDNDNRNNLLSDRKDDDNYRDETPRAKEYSTPGDENVDDKRTKIKNENGRLHLLVTDDRGFPLPDADVDLTDCYGSKGYTGGDGKFYFDELLRPIDCSVTIRKRGYKDATIALRDFGKQNVKIAMAGDVRESFRGYVYDSRSNAPIRGVAVQVQLADGVLETATDEKGFYALDVEPGLTYLVSYNKYGYTDAIVRTKFPFNSNNRLADVLLDKAYDDNSTRRDDYVAYDQNDRPLTHNTEDRTSTTKLLLRDKSGEVKKADPNKFNGYAIQLAAMPENPSDAKLRTYEPLTRIGNIYVKTEDRLNKIRLGIFPTQAEADAALKSVLSDRAYKGSWVVEERGADESLILGNENLTPIPHNDESQSGKGIDNTGVRYALQLGSYGANKPIAISEYTPLNGLGNLYSKSENGYTKVRLGVWGNYSEAEKAKTEAVRRGFPDATIITERADDPNIRDFMLSAPANNNAVRSDKKGVAPIGYSETTEKDHPYLVRIAALSNPDRFDAAPLDGLGTIVKRRAENNPNMTVILLGNYADFDTANKMAKRLISIGYPDAYVVKDENGKLIRK